MMQEVWRTWREKDKPVYPVKLQDQIEALRIDGQLKDFQKVRTELKGDPYRPQYHFLRPDGRLNDPNGLCYWQGRWHLFYQAVDGSSANIHWGHAVSDDLIQWKDLPFAIYPGVETACWSGSCLVEEDGVIAAFYGYTPERNCGVIIARSSDPLLLNWEKVNGGQPVVRETPETHDPHAQYRVFDPYLWREGNTYYMLTGGYRLLPGDKRCTRQEYLFRSENLVDWEFLHSFLKDDNFAQVGDDGACPYFLPLGDRHLLLHYSHIGGPKYLIGDYSIENHTFTPTNGGKFAAGYYVMTAPSAMPVGKEAVVIFNMKEGKPNNRWLEIMTLPRRLYLMDYDMLGVKPAAELTALRAKHTQVQDISLPVGKEIDLPEISGNCTEIMLSADVQSLELNILKSPDAQEYTRISFLRKKGAGRGMDMSGVPADSLIMLDATHASLDPDVSVYPPECSPVLIGDDEKLQLHIFIDKSVVEVFVNDRQCICQRVYPTRNDSTGVSIMARGGDGTLISMDCWQINSIYE